MGVRARVEFKAVEDPPRDPERTLQVANVSAVVTCADVMASTPNLE